MSYTQRELLLLSNFVYIPACVSEKTVKEIIDSFRDEGGSFTEESVIEAARGGGMSCADVATVFTCMDERISENPSFGNISAARRLLSLSCPDGIPVPEVSADITDFCKRGFLCGESAYGKRNAFTLADADSALSEEL